MKRLALLRHAKSDWADAGKPDFERPLNTRGREAARAIGRSMHDEDLHFDLILASPATRSVETLDEASHAYGAAEHRTLDEDIYLASPVTLLDLVRGISDDVQGLLIVGHNPGLERLALMLSRRGGADREKLAEKFPTGALIEIVFDVEHWADVAEGSGTISRFTTPKDLRST